MYKGKKRENENKTYAGPAFRSSFSISGLNGSIFFGHEMSKKL